MSPEREFRFTEQPEVRGVSKELVADLLDIASKWGQVFPDEQVTRFSSSLLEVDEPLFLAAGPIPEPITLLVFKTSGPERGISILDTDSLRIFWDNSLEAATVKKIVVDLDAKAIEYGLINERDGERIPIPEELVIGKAEKFKVGEIFQKKGTSVPVFSLDPEEILAQFDHPEELMVFELPNGSRAIIHKRDQAYLGRRRKITEEFLKERGINLNNEEGVAELSIEEVMNLRDEIARRIQEEDGNS